MIKTEILVKFWEDREGNLIGAPVYPEVEKRIVDHLKGQRGYTQLAPYEGLIFLQRERDIKAFKKALSVELLEDLEEGFDIIFPINPRALGSYYGHNTGSFLMSLYKEGEKCE